MPCVFEFLLNTDVFRALPPSRGPAAVRVVVMMLWLEGTMEINYSCCLISWSNPARSPPTGDPPKPTGEQGTLTPPPGTGHQHHSWQRAPSHTHTHTHTSAIHSHTRTYTHTHTRWMSSTLNSLCSSCQKNSLRGRDHWLCDKMGFPHRDTP